MPTGYTAELYDGKDTTFEQFVLRCSRAMGAAVHQREESMNARISKRKPRTYHLDRLDKAVTRFRQAVAMTKAEAAMAAKASYAKRLEEHEASMAVRADRRERYEAMLDAVEEWTPPTEDHEGLKTFMVEQLQTSIEHDCKGFEKYKPEPVTAEQYMQAELEYAQRDVTYHTEEYAKELQRVREQNKWVQALADNLGVEVE